MAVSTLIGSAEPDDFDYDAAVASYRAGHSARMARIGAAMSAATVQPVALARALRTDK